MCGIAGFFNRNAQKRFEEVDATMDGMLKRIAHRGPDDFGKYYFTELTEEGERPKCKIQRAVKDQWTLGLGHTRLSIIDTSEHGRQPLESTDGQIVLIFNGEIYNYLELKTELDYPWQTKTDSEVIIAAYLAWGESMLTRFDGMFSFVLFDKRKNLLFGARDVAGIKPMYYHEEEGNFFFGSQPEVILSGANIAPRWNSTYLAEFLLMGISDHDTGTMIQGVHQLKGGHAFHYDLKNSTLSTFPYHHFSHPEKAVDDRDFMQSMTEAFARQLRSDVPLGTSLSGGIDSSTIASVISSKLPKGHSYSALTFTSSNFADDESELAKIVATNAGLDWVAVEPDGQRLREDIIAMIRNMGEPFSSLSMFAQYQVMKKANELGIKVMLDGQGGDELYMGYPRVAMRVYGHYLGKGKVLKAFQELHGIHQNLSVPYSTALLGPLYFGSKNIALTRKRNVLSKFVDADYLNTYREEVAEDLFANKPIQEKQFDEFYKYCLPRLLRYADRNSMGFAVESRVPHLANPLIDMALALPVEQKVNQGWTKYTVRKNMQGIVPDEILWSRVKRGFDIPQSFWVGQIQKELTEWVTRLPGDTPFRKENILQEIQTNGGNTLLWPVLSAIALHEINNVRFA